MREAPGALSLVDGDKIDERRQHLVLETHAVGGPVSEAAIQNQGADVLHTVAVAPELFNGERNADMALCDNGHVVIDLGLERPLGKRHGAGFQLFVFPLQGGETGLGVTGICGV